jgi:hypothetical protein
MVIVTSLRLVALPYARCFVALVSTLGLGFFSGNWRFVLGTHASWGSKIFGLLSFANSTSSFPAAIYGCMLLANVVMATLGLGST